MYVILFDLECFRCGRKESYINFRARGCPRCRFGSKAGMEAGVDDNLWNKLIWKEKQDYLVNVLCEGVLDDE